jgi:hypothetical protein
MERFDIAPFALPGGPAGTCRFEEPRDIAGLRLAFAGTSAPRNPGALRIEYLQKSWPRIRVEDFDPSRDPTAFGWISIDDQWNSAWRRAATRAVVDGRAVEVTFLPLARDRLPVGAAPGPKASDTYRRTLGIRAAIPSGTTLRRMEVFSVSRPAVFAVRIRLDAGRRTPGKQLKLSAYNARILSIGSLRGITRGPDGLRLGAVRDRELTVRLAGMDPAHPACGDGALLTASLDRETFTVSVADLGARGPVWYAEQGVIVTLAPDATSFDEYRARFRGARTTLQRVAGQREQTFAGPFLGQPRGQPANFSFGCAGSPQRFWLEANGDLILHRENLDFFGRRPAQAEAMKTRGNARFFFGLERWVACARFAAPRAVPVYTIMVKRGGLLLEQTSLCVPVLRGVEKGALAWEEPTAALLRFRFTNRGDAEERAVLGTGYSQDSTRSVTALRDAPGFDDYRVPLSTREPVHLEEGAMTSGEPGARTVRAVYRVSGMRELGDGTGWEGLLAPNASCEVVVTIPFLPPADDEGAAALRRLDFEECRTAVSRFWLDIRRRGAGLSTPVPRLDAVHDAHLSHILFSDVSMPGNPGLVNTSVGSSTYGNFVNESCMIIQELDQRGLASEAEKRLQVYLDYAGTARQPGNFTDFEGSFYGAGGWESGDYNQHHGWALWYLAEHFLLTGDRAWFAKAAPKVVAGADWVFRQRRETMRELPHSRGWERGFLPAGSLEDVTDFQYWLSTNSLTWRGTDAAARALERAGHPDAARVRAESDAYQRDLLRGFTLGRQHAPLVPLRDGRWVPHYPSRLYRRGRDVGWIRELLEGAVYLIISGLIAPDAPEAGWILDDYQDNLYNSPPFGFVMRDPDALLRHRGGFSIQPNLLAGLLPHLDRDEIEIYLWMFFNAWVSCYREEIDGMIEHPMPELGFDNSTGFKTSDEANAVMWLRAMLVYSTPRLLHLGRALPREWLRDGEGASVTGVRTCYGLVSARWIPEPSRGMMTLEAELSGNGDEPPSFLARFRHPRTAPIDSVTVNGKPWDRFDPGTGDVDVTGLRGNIRIVTRYASRDPAKGP